MILLLLIIAVLMAAPAAAEPRDPWGLQQWIWPRKSVPIPLPAPLPKEEPLPQVPIEDIPIPLVVPAPPPAPAVVAPVQPTRPKPKPRPRDDDDDDDRPAKARPVQPKCKPITIDCNTVCSLARTFSAGTLEALRLRWGYCAPTASERAQGKACMLKQCPEVLKP